MIAYETTPHLKGGAYTYIVQGALNEIQGVPHEDWELDLPTNEEAEDTEMLETGRHEQDIGEGSSGTRTAVQGESLVGQDEPVLVS